MLGIWIKVLVFLPKMFLSIMFSNLVWQYSLPARCHCDGLCSVRCIAIVCCVYYSLWMVTTKPASDNGVCISLNNRGELFLTPPTDSLSTIKATVKENVWLKLRNCLHLTWKHNERNPSYLSSTSHTLFKSFVIIFGQGCMLHVACLNSI